jgi:DNA-binding Lrp family transcriptional regulator
VRKEGYGLWKYDDLPMQREGGDNVIKAYILVSLVPGLESDTVSQISVLPGVRETDLVFGHWDVVVQVEAKSIPDLSQMVINQIRGLQGVQTTETLIGGMI